MGNKHKLLESINIGNNFNRIRVLLKNFNFRTALFSMKIRVIFTVIISVCVLLLITNKYTIFIFLSISLFYIIFKVFLTLFAILEPKQTKEDININNDLLPFYSVMICLYKEQDIIPQLLNSLSQIDYPVKRIEILIVVEIDDLETQKILYKNKLQENIRIIKVPFFIPRTKPKALNYALGYCRGEFLAVYDAEDLISSSQMKESIIFFEKDKNKEYGAVQAILHFYNKNQNYLTKLFYLEYFHWFLFSLRSLCAIFKYTPLGGSSNHFRKSTILEISGWDPYNVTEDLDISIKLLKKNYKIGFLNSYTEEQCPYKLKSWLKQRIRWIKGYILTYIIYFTDSFKFKKDQFILFHLFVGFSWFNFLISPFFFILLKKAIFIFILYFIFISCFIMLTSIHYNLFKKKDIFLIIIIIPLYFILHVISAYLAIIDIIRRPFYWSKTEHTLKTKI